MKFRSKFLKILGVWIVIKILLLSALFYFVFYSAPTSDAVAAKASPTPTPAPTSSDKITRETSDPYSGDLARFDRENRAENLKIERVMDELKIKEGSKVADIGAGGGWFSVIAAKRVGEKGTVYANDIREDAAKYIDERAKKAGLTNIRTFTGTEDDPKLPKDEDIDAVLFLNVYHEVAQPVILLKNLSKSLKKGALVGVIERDGDADSHGISPDLLKKEFEQAGYKFVAKFDFVKKSRMDYFSVFKKVD